MINVELNREDLEVLLINTVAPTKMFNNNKILNMALSQGLWCSQTYRLLPDCFENLTLDEMWVIYKTNKAEIAAEPKAEIKYDA